MAAEQSPRGRRDIDWGKIIDHALEAEGDLHGVYNRFHEYSAGNMYLFLMQGLHEPIASRKRWISLGRTVLDNAVPKDVIVPNIRRSKVRDENGEWQTIERVTGFLTVQAVYGVSGTQGEALQPPKP